MNRRIAVCSILAALYLTAFSTEAFSQTVLDTPDVESVLYLGEGKDQPLIVGLGGSEGGNAWTSDRWKPTRDEFIKRGYAFLAIGYFGAKGTPTILDRISIDKVHDAIAAAAKDPKINKDKIAIVGGSRGGDLALLLGSYYKDIKCVVAIVPSHVAFPGHTSDFATSAWTYSGKELPFVPVTEDTVPFLIKRDLRGAFETMLKDPVAEEKALIKVENINGPVLLMSATKDEIVPTTPMSEKIVARLKAKGFKHHYEHIPIPGSHAEPLKHFNKVLTFLDDNFVRGR
jgi:dipeptidyl aminopeptidase/acylaminoacyl peptidase